MTATSIETVGRDFPQQVLSLFTDKSGWLVSTRLGYAVFYVSADGSTWCPDCANQDEAEPPIVAGQILGKNEQDLPQICNGCSKPITPLRVVRQNANARYIYHMSGTVILIAYETPVAMYDQTKNEIFETDINWSISLSKQLYRFRKTMKMELWKRLGFTGSIYDSNTPTVKTHTCLQEDLDAKLVAWTGRERLAETRDKYDNYHQGVKERVDTSFYVGRYEGLRKELASRKTHKVVICE